MGVKASIEVVLPVMAISFHCYHTCAAVGVLHALKMALCGRNSYIAEMKASSQNYYLPLNIAQLFDSGIQLIYSVGDLLTFID